LQPLIRLSFIHAAFFVPFVASSDDKLNKKNYIISQKLKNN